MNAPLPQDGPLHSLQFWAEIRSECRHKWIHILFLQQGKIFLLLPKTPVPQFYRIVLDPAVAGWLPFTQSQKHGPQGRSWSASVCGDPRDTLSVPGPRNEALPPFHRKNGSAGERLPC
ncbi:MAG: hypothetical protein CW346_13365, partial [Bacillaceae bacterium]|nr:hypothetical protein [Bacillaceae bacterium]